MIDKLFIIEHIFPYTYVDIGFLSLSLSHSHTHTHLYIYIYIILMFAYKCNPDERDEFFMKAIYFKML